MEAILLWLLATLLAIAVFGDRPSVGLGLALLGGIASGLSAFIRYRAAPGEAAKGHAEPPPEQ